MSYFIILYLLKFAIKTYSPVSIDGLTYRNSHVCHFGKLDDGWPESAEEQVTLVSLEVVHKRTLVNVLILIELMNRKEMR